MRGRKSFCAPNAMCEQAKSLTVIGIEIKCHKKLSGDFLGCPYPHDVSHGLFLAQRQVPNPVARDPHAVAVAFVGIGRDHGLEQLARVLVALGCVVG